MPPSHIEEGAFIHLFYQQRLGEFITLGIRLANIEAV